MHTSLLELIILEIKYDEMRALLKSFFTYFLVVDRLFESFRACIIYISGIRLLLEPDLSLCSEEAILPAKFRIYIRFI